MMGKRGSAQQNWCLEFEAWVEEVLGVRDCAQPRSKGVAGEEDEEDEEEAAAAQTQMMLCEREELLANWITAAPHASMAHPGCEAECHRTTWPPAPGASPGEHLVPLFFAFGAAGGDAIEGPSASCVHKEYLGSLPMAAYEFGRAQ